MGPKPSATSSTSSGSKKQKAGTKKTAATTAISHDTKGPIDWRSCANCAARFTLLTSSSLLLSTALFSLSVPITHGDLAWTSKRLDSWWCVVCLLSWRVLELAVPWVMNYDARDVASLIGLVHLPTYSLLLNFYGLRPTTILTVSAITIFSCTAPFLYFRPVSSIHSGGTPASSRHILRDWPTTVYTTAIASLVYTIGLYLSFATWLPVFLVTYFDGLPDISAVHEGAKGFVSIFLALLPAGYATRDFLFVSSASQPGPRRHRRRSSASSRPGEEEEKPNELLISWVYRKAWAGLPTRRKVLISRAAVLAFMISANTIVQLVGTINGVELIGAMGWGMLWSLGAVVNAVIYGWIEAAEGI